MTMSDSKTLTNPRPILTSDLSDHARSSNICGTWAPQFDAVYETFVRNFTEQGELGACIALYQDGKPVIDLWGGFIDREKTLPWQRKTIANVQSTVKALYAFIIHTLVDEGRVDLDAPVADYWKSFGQAGKAKITVRQLVSHHAGLIYLDHAPPGSGRNPEVLKAAIEKQKPEWPPGTKGAYHSSTIMPLLDFFVEEVTGQDMNTLFRERVTIPLDIEVFPQLQSSELALASPAFIHPDHPTFKAIRDPDNKIGRAWRFLLPAKPGPPPSVQMPYPGAPYASARGFARFAGALALGGKVDGVRIMSPQQVAEMGKEQWEEQQEGLTDRHFRMAAGFFMGTDFAYMGQNRSTFGAPGGGGQLFFVDPHARLGFGYLCNRGYPSSDLGARCRALVDAIYSSISQ